MRSSGDVPDPRGDRPPAVLHLAHELGGGGLERMAVNLSNHLAAAGHDVHLGTWGDPSADFYDPLVAPDVRRVRFRRFPSVRGRSIPVRVARRALGVSDLARYLRRHRVTVVHAHNESTLRVAVAARRFAPTTAVVWHHHDGDPSFRPPRAVGRAVRAADRILVVTDPMANWARTQLAVDPAIVSVLPNFVEPVARAVRPGDGRPRAGTGPDLPGTRGRRLVCLANFRESKGHRSLVRAMAEVVEAVPDAHLLLVGGPSEPGVREAVRAQVDGAGLSARITLLGRRHDVEAVLAACDVGVLASHYEGAPLALLEYARAGLPVVATAVGGCPAIIGDDGACGTLVAPGDPGALADAVVAYLRDPELRSALGAGLRSRTGDRFRAAVTVEQLRAVYAGVEGRRRPAPPVPIPVSGMPGGVPMF